MYIKKFPLYLFLNFSLICNLFMLFISRVSSLHAENYVVLTKHMNYAYSNKTLFQFVFQGKNANDSLLIPCMYYSCLFEFKTNVSIIYGGGRTFYGTAGNGNLFNENSGFSCSGMREISFYFVLKNGKIHVGLNAPGSSFLLWEVSRSYPAHDAITL